MQEDLTIYPSQIKGLYRSLKKKLFKIAASVFIFFFFTLILKNPPSYVAEATFKQAQSRNDDLSQLQSFIQNVVMPHNDSDAITVMQSKKLLRKVVEEMGLQMAISDRGFLSSLLHKFVRNFAAEFRIFMEDTPRFEFRTVLSDNELPRSIYLKFLTPERFEILNEKKQCLAEGTLGKKVDAVNLSFTLQSAPSPSLNKLYPVVVLPLGKIVETLQKKMVVKTSKIDKSLICLSYSLTSRKQAAELVNCLMSEFQKYLRREHEEIADAQLAYLEKRQNYLSGEFNKALENHAAYLSQNLGKNGFIGISQELEMLAIPKETYTSKLFDLDLELKRWQHLESGCQQFAELARQNNQEAKREEQLVSLDLAEQGLVAAGLIPLSSDSSHLEAQFLGIDLVRLQDLYGQYSEEKDNLQSEIDQLTYIQDQMRSAQFELSSLSNLLKDPVSMEMITKASRLSLELHDEQNRMPKEQERLKEALLTQKSFISDHLAQSIELFKIKLRHLNEKMSFLQNKAATLIKNEKKLLRNKLADLHDQMKDFPEKWYLENQLKLKKDLTMKIIEGMTKLTESKVVHHHLFQIESKPLDHAVPPILPKFPNLICFSLLCGMLSSLIYFLFHLILKMLHGFPICAEWLADNNQHFSGKIRASQLSLSEIKRNDLETLRNCAGFISLNKKKVVPIIGDAHCTHALSELLGLQGKKTIFIEATFKSSKETSGLLQYLTGEMEHLLPLQKTHYDFLPSGGYHAFGVELLNGAKFHTFLDQLKKEYDCILIATSAKPNSLEVECLARHADGLIFLLDEETPQEIKHFIQWDKNRNERSLTFIMLK